MGTTPLRIAQIGKETAYGTAVAATVKLMELNGPPDLRSEGEVYQSDDQGRLGPASTSAVVRANAMATIPFKWTFEDAPYYLQAITGAQTPTGAGPYTRIYDMPYATKPPSYPYTIQGGEAGDAYRMPGGLLQSITREGDWDGDGVITGTSEWNGVKKEALAAGNEVQTVTVTGTPTGGDFTLGFQGQVTAAIAYNAAAAAVQSALEALTTIGSGNVAAAGGALPGTPVTVTFQGTLAGADVPLLTLVTNGLTGGTTPTVTIAETTRGGGLSAVADRTVELMRMADVALWIDSFGGTIGTTAITQALVSFTAELTTSRHSKGFAGSVFSVGHGYGRYGGSLTLTMEKAVAAVKALADAPIAGTKAERLIRLRATSGTKVWTLDFAGTLQMPGDVGDRDGNTVQELVFAPLYDATNGFWWKETVVNSVSSLAA